jgi:hypothetical protein
MIDPLNRLPIDPEWARKCDEGTQKMAAELGCLVVVIAIQDGGKLGVCVAGEPDAGKLAGITKDMPRFFGALSLACGLSDAVDTQKTRQ